MRCDMYVCMYVCMCAYAFLKARKVDDVMCVHVMFVYVCMVMYGWVCILEG